jgi:hypothetical protein
MRQLRDAWVKPAHDYLRWSRSTPRTPASAAVTSRRRRARKHMGKDSKSWCIVGFFGLVGAATAQTPLTPAATTQFDGTYAFVSATTLNQTFMAGGTRPGQCPERKAGPLTIVRGQARYSSRRVNGAARSGWKEQSGRRESWRCDASRNPRVDTEGLRPVLSSPLTAE